MNRLGFWHHAQQHPSQIAVVDVDGRETTAGELLASANRAVHGLRHLGLQPGDCVAVVLANGREVFELYMAAAQAGWYLTPINWHLTASEIAYILRDSGARALVCSERFAEPCKEAARRAEVPEMARFAVGAIPGFRPYQDLLSGQPDTTPDNRRAGGAMTYTSGTTGHPKGVRRPVATLDPETAATQQSMFLSLFGIGPGSAGVHLVGSPIYHTAVLNFSSNHLHLGHSLVLMDKWTPIRQLELTERYRVTSTHMVPTQFNRLLRLSDEQRARYDLSSLTHVVHSAAPCPVEVKRHMLTWWGPCIYEYYAASEGGGTLATPEAWLQKPGTVGTAWPISEIRVLDDNHQLCPPGQAGTVWMRMGEHRFEYHKDQKKTGDAWRDGFFTVGDAGYLDGDGFLFLCDRKIDMIISGGVNIYPAEIEAVLALHPAVADVAVFGVPHEDWGESVMAVIEPVAGSAAGDELAQAILHYAGERLAKYKLPREIEFIAEMPRDPNGKLYKRKLRDPHWEGRSRAI
jgi:long-chain acyl-CoA synthetase